MLMVKKHMTWNITLIIKGEEEPKESFPGRSQHLTGPTQQGRFECPLYFSHAPLLCDKTTWSRAQLLFPWHSSSPEPVCEPPASHIQMGYHRPKPLSLLYPTYSSITEWYMYHVWQLRVSLFFFLPHQRHPIGAVLSHLAWAKWAGPHKSKEEVPSPLKPHPWTCAAATHPVLLLEFTQWYSRSAFSLYK